MSIVTAVIPCYNAEAYLQTALDSVKAQTMPVEEILVIDDGSADGSAAIARASGARVLTTGGQFGPGTARNIGLREARTPYLAFLDADDQWLPHHIETLFTLLRASPEAGAAFGWIQYFGPDGDIATHHRVGADEAGTLAGLMLHNSITQSAAIAQRAAILAVGGYREGMRYAEDYDLWLRMAERYTLIPCPIVTCRYRVHPAQATMALPRMTRGSWDARMAACERLRKRGALTSEHARVLREALEDDVRHAWAMADRESLEHLLELTDRIEGGETLEPAIRSRMRWLPFRRITIAVKRLTDR